MAGNHSTYKRGEQHPRAKLTERVVRRMRKLHKKYGICTSCIAKMHKANYQTVWDIIQYNTWRHVL